MSRVQRIITMHCTNHIERGASDAVWGEALCSVGDVNVNSLYSAGEWRVVTFDGRRGKQINLRPKFYATRRAADEAFNTKFAAKEREGYLTVEWTNPYYGLMPTIRDIDPDFFDMTVTLATTVGWLANIPLWHAVYGRTGNTIPQQELIDSFNQLRQFTGGQIDLVAQRQRDIQQVQLTIGGRFPADSSIGAHVFLWNGLARDPDFVHCGVCNKNLSKHARLVINHQGRLARHIFKTLTGTTIFRCKYCGLDYDDRQGRLVHSSRSAQNEIEYISGRQALDDSTAETATIVERETTVRVGNVDTSGFTTEQLRNAQELLAQQIASEADRMIEETLITGTLPSRTKPKPARKPEGPKPDPQTHERTGGLLDFDI